MVWQRGGRGEARVSQICGKRTGPGESSRTGGGAGLIRSMGGWSEVVSISRLGLKEKSDDRILGSGDFVNEIVGEADLNVRQRFSDHERAERIQKHIREQCREQRVNVEELRAGSRRPEVSRLRRRIAMGLLEAYGVPMAEIARLVGVTTSAISKIVRRSG